MDRISDEALEALAIFPLPNVVLFPGMALPLHIFEPRYRDLLAHVLTTEDRALGIAILRPGFETEYEGRPPVHEIVGGGVVAAHERLPDGRYNLVVQGIERLRIEREHPPVRTFRLVRCERVHEASDGHTAEADATLRGLLLHIGASRGETGAALGKLLAAAKTPARLADLLAASLLPEVTDRLSMLSEPDVTTRLRRVTDALAQRSLEGFSGGGPGDAC